MSKYVMTLVLGLCCLSVLIAQPKPSDYSFVVVPEKFEFQKEDDQYQLNSLTKFLFNKYGFHAYNNIELPNVSRCDGLWSDIILKPGIIWTKIRISLKDCHGNEIFRSAEGRSKLKEYKQAYHEAIRQAFESIVALQVQQKELQLFDTSLETAKAPDVSSDKKQETVGIPKVVSKEIPVEAMAENVLLFTNNGLDFSLKKQGSGHALYEINNEVLTLKGYLEKKEDTMIFKDTSGNEFPSYFDSKKNLVIESSFQKIVFKALH